MRSALGIGKIFDTNLYVDWTWGFMFLLVLWGLADAAFPALHPQWGPVLTWSTALAAALFFFASVLAHELAHAGVAKANGIPVREIRLLVFGGESGRRCESMSPTVEMAVFFAGPVTGLVLGLILLFLGGATGINLPEAQSSAVQVLAGLGPLATLLLWSGATNFLLGALNLIPIFPLDGGRVLRSLLCASTGNLPRSTEWARRVGQAIAWVLILVGISMMLGVWMPFLRMGSFAGLGLALAGWLLYYTAGLGYRKLMAEGLLKRAPVIQHLGTRVPTVPPNIPIRSLVDDYVWGSDERFIPVIDNNRLVGLVCFQDVRQVPRDRWDTTEVGEIMVSVSQLAILKPGQPGEADELHVDDPATFRYRV
ncbi:MAG: site-2 protease family protein [Acidobacteriota bacterium]